MSSCSLSVAAQLHHHAACSQAMRHACTNSPAPLCPPTPPHPQPFLLHLLLDAARGMAYVHSRGICHGDLKACNVLVAAEPGRPFGCCAKVRDFGLSRALALGASHLSTRSYGTVTHMVPELLASGHLRQASDVYSFGIMGARPAPPAAAAVPD